MHSKYFILLMIFLVFSWTSYADDMVDVVLQKDAYSSKETMVVEVLLKEQPVRAIASSDFSLSEGSIAPILVKHTEGHYYAYFDLPVLEEGSHKVSVNLLYNVDNVLKEISFEKEFSIAMNEAFSIGVSPAVLKIDAGKMQSQQINVRNNNENDIEIDLIEDIEYMSLSKGTLSFQGTASRSFFVVTDKNKIASNETGYVKLRYDGNEFKIPLLIHNFKEKIIGNTTNNTENIEEMAQNNFTAENTTAENPGNITNKTSKTNGKDMANDTKKKAIDFMSYDSKLVMSMDREDYFAGPLVLKNYMDNEVDVTFEVSGNLNEIIRLNVSHVEAMQPGSTFKQQVFINEGKNANLDFYYGAIIANSSKGDAILPVEISIARENAITRGRKAVEDIIERDDDALKEPFPLNFTDKNIVKRKKDNSNKVLVLLFLLIIGIMAFAFYKIMSGKKPKNFDEYISSLER